MIKQAKLAQPNNTLLTEVGRYHISSELGRGAMAVVYKARDPVIDRTLAIKVLHREFCVNKEYRGRFLREAKAAGILSHPNIVTIFDVGESDGQPYIAMEEVEGTSLAEFMHSPQPLAVRDVVEIGIQLARALAYAHKKGIVHRDIKPSNVMRVKDTNIIKVTDFGICHLERTDKTTHTKFGEILGTPNYMSPEQVTGTTVDGRSDLFSAGIILYQLLTGKRPFEGDSLASVMYKITQEDIPPLEKWRPDLPAALKNIIERCLKKEPDKRFQNGDELAEALICVIQSLDEAAKLKEIPRYIPLRIKWTLIVASVVAITMTFATLHVYHKQYAAMVEQVVEYGGSLVKFMATENAVPILTEDWVAVEVYVQEISDRQEFAYITVVDHNETIRGSSRGTDIGAAYPPIDGVLVSSAHETIVRSHELPDGQNVFDFQAPVLFQDRQIGRVHLGIYQKPLAKVANLSLWLMTVLIIITVAAVMVATYIIANSFSRPIKVLLDSMKHMEDGQFDHRIAQERKDEFGRLFIAFDNMADAIEHRNVHEKPPEADKTQVLQS